MTILSPHLDPLMQSNNCVVRRADKVPLNPNTGRNASVTNSADWSTYEVAAACCAANPELGLGVVLTKQLGITFIDLDTHKTTDPKVIARHERIAQLFQDSYSEASPNGGRHIFVKGNIESAVKLSNLHIEMYDCNRYATITGKPFNDVPIKNCNGTLTKLWADLKAEQGNNNSVPTDFQSQPETQSDEHILNAAAHAANGDLFKQLLAGNWQSKYKSQSEADFSFTDIVAFYSDSKEQVKRIFLQSALGERIRTGAKRKHANYINDMVEKSFDRKVSPGVGNNFNDAFEAKFTTPIDPAFSIEGIKSIYDYDCKGIDYAIQDFIACAAITLIASESGSGKTTVMSHAAHAIANGKSFLGYPAQPPRKVLFLDRENALPVLIERFERLGIKDSGNFKYWGNHVTGNVPFPLPNIVTEWVANTNPKPVVIVDSLIAFLEGKENSSDDIRKFFNRFDVLKTLGAAIVVLHHSGKTENTKQYRGSSDIKGAIDNGYSLVNAGDNRLTNLTLTAFKTRFAVDESIAMKYENGKLFNKDSKQQGNEILTDILFNNSEITTSEFEELAFAVGIKRGVARMFLTASCENGSVVMRPGEKHSKLYSLAHKVDLQNMAGKVPWQGS
jgi:hypothetical protein